MAHPCPELSLQNDSKIPSKDESASKRGRRSIVGGDILHEHSPMDNSNESAKDWNSSSTNCVLLLLRFLLFVLLAQIRRLKSKLTDTSIGEKKE